MRTLASRAVLALVPVTLLLGACASETTTSAASGVEIRDARIPAPAGENGALYMVVRNNGAEDDRLVAAATDVAAAVELHETVMEGDTMTMRPVEGYDVPAGGELALERGGKHIMLLGVDPLEVGDVVTVTLEFEDAGAVVVEAEVVPQVAETDTTMGM